jgi:Omp85 superfamily domain
MPRVRGVRIGSRFLRTALGILLPALAALPAAADTAGDGPRRLGRLEQESVDDAMASLGVHVDPAPQGKTIGKIHVVNQDVFSKRDWYFQLFNIFHWTTRSYILERELLLRPGQPYDQALVEESTRNLQSPAGIIVQGKTVGQPELSSVVVLLPVASAIPGQVDLLLVTRDVWSLRFNTNFEYQQNALTLLETSLSENNLFGRRKYLSLGFSFDQGKYYYGPTYQDPNIRGTRMTLYAQALFYTSRATAEYEGTGQIAALRYPLYSLASKWGAGVDVTHVSNVARVFQGNTLRQVDLAGTPEIERFPYEYRRRVVVVDANAVRSFRSAAVIQRATVGYLADRRSAQVVSTFPGDAATARLFLSEWAPIPEQRSEPYLRYEVFTPRYVVLRDLDTFDLRENRQLGPLFRARVSEGLTALGASFSALGVGVEAGFAAAPAGGFVSVTAAASGRLLPEGRWIDQLGGAQVFVATPIVGGLFRIVAEAQVQSKRADTTNTPFVLGGANGLRGYAIGEFIGTTVLVGHIEVRTVPIGIWSQRVGMVAFYDIGNAAPSFADLLPRNDVGLGLRWLAPQFNSTVIRIDWAVPLQNGVVTPAGTPGRFSAGFAQVF